jgi:hypothetical protein
VSGEKTVKAEPLLKAKIVSVASTSLLRGIEGQRDLVMSEPFRKMSEPFRKPRGRRVHQNHVRQTWLMAGSALAGVREMLAGSGNSLDHRHLLAENRIYG